MVKIYQLPTYLPIKSISFSMDSFSSFCLMQMLNVRHKTKNLQKIEFIASVSVLYMQLNIFGKLYYVKLTVN